MSLFVLVVLCSEVVETLQKERLCPLGLCHEKEEVAQLSLNPRAPILCESLLGVADRLPFLDDRLSRRIVLVGTCEVTLQFLDIGKPHQ